MKRPCITRSRPSSCSQNQLERPRETATSASAAPPASISRPAKIQRKPGESGLGARRSANSSTTPSGKSSRYGSRRSIAAAWRKPRSPRNAGEQALSLRGEDQVEELGPAGDTHLRVHLRQVLLDGLLAVSHHRADLRRGQALE